MSSLAIKLPLVKDSSDGFKTIKSFRQLIKQNFKMLLLTNKGERVMIPEYGVGMKRFLFSNFDEATFARIENEIIEQASIYIPVVNIIELAFVPSETNPNALIIKIVYSIPDINVRDLLEFTI
jgi:phage baseplate assembly protein W|tara:strand:+ start:2606 stop:2974 length:369 start_codon:yes stop_codon:yes gene_type:complete